MDNLYLHRATNDFESKFDSRNYGIFAKTLEKEIKENLAAREAYYLEKGLPYDEKFEFEVLLEVMKNLGELSNRNFIIAYKHYLEFMNDDFNYFCKFIDTEDFKYMSGITSEAAKQVGINASTDFISTSCDIRVCGDKYTSEQKSFSVLTILSERKDYFTPSNLEFTDNDVVAIDFTNKDILLLMNNMGFFKTKDGRKYDSGYRGFNYGPADEQVVFLKYIPSTKIAYKHDQFSYDLVVNGLIDLDKLCTMRNKYVVMAQLKDETREHIKEICEKNKEKFALELFDELYVKNIPTSRLINDYLIEIDDKNKKRAEEQVRNSFDTYKKTIFECIDIPEYLRPDNKKEIVKKYS